MTAYKAVIKSIWKNEGVKGFYRGYWAMFWRDVPAYGLLFFTYEYLRREFIYPTDSTAIVYLKKLFCIGFAGVLNWGPTFPFDVIKNIIQSCDRPKPRTIMEVAREGYKAHKFQFFLTGLTPCILMAFPVNVIIFMVYEHLSDFT